MEAGSSTAALLVWSAHSKAMIETEILLHAVLSWTTSLLIGAMPTSHARTTLSLKAFEHNSQCLNSLRDSLSQNDLPTAIVPAELYAGNLSAAMVHFNALTAIVESNGGLRKLSWPLQKLVIVADMTVSGQIAAVHFRCRTVGSRLNCGDWVSIFCRSFGVGSESTHHQWAVF
jgi:hypothetical protein